MGSRNEGAHRPTMRGASRSARTFTGGARRRPAPSSTFTLGGAKGSTPAPGVPGPVRTGGGGASTVCGVAGRVTTQNTTDEHGRRRFVQCSQHMQKERAAELLREAQGGLRSGLCATP